MYRIVRASSESPPLWVRSCHWAASSSSEGRCSGAHVAGEALRVPRLVGDLHRLVGQREQQLLAGGELRQVEVDRPVGDHPPAHGEAELAVEVACEQLAGDAVAHVVAEQVDLGEPRARRPRPRWCRLRRGCCSGDRACRRARSRRSRAGSPAASPASAPSTEAKSYELVGNPWSTSSGGRPAPASAAGSSRTKTWWPPTVWKAPAGRQASIVNVRPRARRRGCRGSPGRRRHRSAGGRSGAGRRRRTPRAAGASAGSASTSGVASASSSGTATVSVGVSP